MSHLVFALLLQSAAPSGEEAAPPPTPRPPACNSEEHAGFDFWLGEWDVYAAANPDTKIADSRIERKHAGCAVIESWMSLRGQGGTSLNHYDAATGQWRQKWVGSSLGAVEFSGGVTGGKMVLTGNWPAPNAPHQLVRMTYTANDDGSVRQFGEASTDHGLSWQVGFDLTYRPKKDAP